MRNSPGLADNPMKIHRLGKWLSRTAEGIAGLILLAGAAIMLPLAMLGSYLLDTLHRKERTEGPREHAASPAICARSHQRSEPVKTN
jgi:hypothetical protein